MTAYGLALLAGLLSVLSPCVLPLVPLVFGAAASESRFGPAALAAGLTISFVAIGLFVATIGFSLGLDGAAFRSAGAVVMVAVGILLVAPPLQARLAFAGGPLSDWADRRIERLATRGVLAQFGVGLLLGLVWSPCVGPTLGAASALAAQGQSLGSVGLTMLAFGLGAALPLAAIGLLSRRALAVWRGRMLSTSKGAKILLGASLALFGLLILSGLDHAVESWAVEASPAWLTDLTTRF
jgi:cytochrome c biogenesis protein CcdA